MPPACTASRSDTGGRDDTPPYDDTGLPARAVDAAARRGVLWVNSAGNFAQRHWQGVFADDVNAWCARTWPSLDAAALANACAPRTLSPPHS